jgi:hypothetical protein
MGEAAADMEEMEVDEHAEEEEDDEDEEQEEGLRPQRVLRCDVARGLQRGRSGAVRLKRREEAPPFVIAFELEDPTSIPRLALDAIWGLNNAACCIEKGERGVFIRGVPGLALTVEPSPGGTTKCIIEREEPDGSRTPLQEMTMQIRIQEVCAKGVRRGGLGGAPATEEVVERYALLVARSPLAFSLRKAAYMTTKAVGRLVRTDRKYADERRRVWAQLAMHVRSGVPPYRGGSELMRKYECSMDWMRSGEMEGFTCLFSAQMAMDWIRTHFLQKHTARFAFSDAHDPVGQLCVRGLAHSLSLGVEGALVGPRFVEQCRRYDLDVDRETERTSAPEAFGGGKRARPSAFDEAEGVGRGGGGGGGGRGRGGRGRGGRGRGGRGRGGGVQAQHHQSSSEGGDSDGGGGGGGGPMVVPVAQGDEPYEPAQVHAYEGLELEEEEEEEEGGALRLSVRDEEDEEDLNGGGGGLPRCVVSLEVVLATSVERQMALVEFQQHMGTFPESVMLELLRVQLCLPVELMRQMGRRMRREGLVLNQSDLRDLVMGGGEYRLGRAMLAHGDAVWGRQMMAMMEEVEGAEARLKTVRDFVRMGFALAFTRAQGSDGYTNGRVASYGRFMAHEGGDASRRECREMYTRMRQLFDAEGEEEEGGGWEGSAMHRGQRLSMELLLSCDRRAWNLRPDNLFLYMQLMVSDVMLGLNYHGSVIDGAFNGIGATVVVRDGGGSFRQWFKDPNSGVLTTGQVMKKRNGTGADYVVGEYKGAVEIGAYEPHFKPEGEVMTEMKRVTELSLVKETCNVYEGVGSSKNMAVKHTITDAMGRKYSTELKAGGDLQSINCMQAIAWLIPRNTLTADSNCFSTTREDASTKERVRVEYRQVIGGYWVICSNHVKDGSRERFRTMLAVTRSVTSAAGGVSMDGALMDGEGDAEFVQRLGMEAARGVRNGRTDPMAGGSETTLDGRGRELFFLTMGTVFFTSFVQWTGMLGQVRETRITAALMHVFYAHLQLCHDLLNPDMTGNGDKLRFLQVSKARGVAMALLGISMRETLEAGRCNESQQGAVERACLSLKVEGSAAAQAWVMADTLEHMLRMDFFTMMQLLGRKLKVPWVQLDELLEWLDSGDPHDCPQAAAFCQRHTDAVRVENVTSEAQLREWEEEGLGFMPPSASDASGRNLTPVEHCMYITHPSLRVAKLETPFTPEVRSRFCNAIAKRLHDEFAYALKEFCQIEATEEGDEILHAMLECSIDRQFAWPSVLMPPQPPKPAEEEAEAEEEEEEADSPPPLRHFWMRGAPPRPASARLRTNPDLMRQRSQLALAPLRMILVETTVAKLGVDVRWLLLVSALGEGQLAQSSRFSIVAQLVQRFYFHCVPNQMMSARDLFTGLPSQVTGAGFIWAPVLQSKRRTLRRSGRSVGMDAPCPTGMVEDMGVAAPRMELAHMLGVDERDLPTDAVHYEFPYGLWTPALVGDAETTPGAVKWSKGKFWVMGDGLARVNATPPPPPLAAAGEGDLYLKGRSTVRVRPVCAFFRPGVLLRIARPEQPEREEEAQEEGSAEWGVVESFLPSVGRYAILTSDAPPSTLRMTPYEVQGAVVRPNRLVRARVQGLRGSGGLVLHTASALHPPLVLPRQGAEAEGVAMIDDWVQGRLECVDTDALVQPGCICLRMERRAPRRQAVAGLFGASHGAKARQECEERYAPVVVVHVSAVVWVEPEAEGGVDAAAGGGVGRTFVFVQPRGAAPPLVEEEEEEAQQHQPEQWAASPEPPSPASAENEENGEEEEEQEAAS